MGSDDNFVLASPVAGAPSLTTLPSNAPPRQARLRQFIAPAEARDAIGSDVNFVLASPVAGVPSLTTLPHQICCMRLICILIYVLSWCLLSLCILYRNPASFVLFIYHSVN